MFMPKLGVHFFDLLATAYAAAFTLLWRCAQPCGHTHWHKVKSKHIMHVQSGMITSPVHLRGPLSHAQVDAIISHAEPYVHSAKKRARRLSVAATDFYRRHSVAPGADKAHEN
jgi:hypothetical protein